MKHAKQANHANQMKHARWLGVEAVARPSARGARRSKLFLELGAAIGGTLAVTVALERSTLFPTIVQANNQFEDAKARGVCPRQPELETCDVSLYQLQHDYDATWNTCKRLFSRP